jgi:predicted enzyme related to lactoylglutathione lyase
MATVDKLTMLSMAVNNMDKVKEFYTDKLGFKVNSDFMYDKDQAGVPAGSRWVSIQPPSGGIQITLTNVFENMKPGSMKLYLSTPDIEAASQELKSKGVKLAYEIIRAGWGTSFGLTDPEGNQWVVVESK